MLVKVRVISVGRIGVECSMHASTSSSMSHCVCLVRGVPYRIQNFVATSLNFPPSHMLTSGKWYSAIWKGASTLWICSFLEVVYAKRHSSPTIFLQKKDTPCWHVGPPHFPVPVLQVTSLQIFCRIPRYDRRYRWLFHENIKIECPIVVKVGFSGCDGWRFVDGEIHTPKSWQSNLEHLDSQFLGALWWWCGIRDGTRRYIRTLSIGESKSCPEVDVDAPAIRWPKNRWMRRSLEMEIATTSKTCRMICATKKDNPFWNVMVSENHLGIREESPTKCFVGRLIRWSFSSCFRGNLQIFWMYNMNGSGIISLTIESWKLSKRSKREDVWTCQTSTKIRHHLVAEFSDKKMAGSTERWEKRIMESRGTYTYTPEI